MIMHNVFNTFVSYIVYYLRFVSITRIRAVGGGVVQSVVCVCVLSSMCIRSLMAGQTSSRASPSSVSAHDILL